MQRIGFQWTEWSTPPVTGGVVVTSWAITFLLGAFIAHLLGFSGFSATAGTIAKTLFAAGAVLFSFAAAAGVTIEPRLRDSEVFREIH